MMMTTAIMVAIVTIIADDDADNDYGGKACLR